MSRSERAAGLIPFIVMLVLFLAAVGWGYISYSAVNKADTGYLARIAKLEKDNAEFKEKQGRMTGHLRKAGSTTGYTSADDEQGMDYETAMTELKTLLNKAVSDNQVTYPLVRYDFPQDGPIEQTPEGAVKVGYIDLKGKTVDSYTWREMPAILAAGLGRMRTHLQDFSRQLNEQRQAVKEAQDAITEVTEQKDQTISQLRNQIQDIQSTYTSQLSDLQDTNNRLENRARQADREKDEAVAASAKLEQEYKNKLLAADQALKRMKVKIDIERAPTADGQVLAASASTRIAVINRGKQDSLKPGTVFEVYNFGKGGVKRAKGLIKVLDVFDASAKCGVLSMNDGDPIVEGDLIANELYNPAKTLRFHVLGRLRKYGTSEAKAVLTRLGYMVDETIGVETDYLLLGEKMNPNDPELEDTAAYKKAKELGLKVVTERDLEAFTQY